MSQANFKINRWLFALSMLTILPSLWLIVSYVRADMKALDEINLALAGIDAKKEAFKLLKEEITNPDGAPTDRADAIKALADGNIAPLSEFDMTGLTGYLTVIDPDNNARGQALLDDIRESNSWDVRLQKVSKLVAIFTSKSGLQGFISNDVTNTSNLIGQDILLALAESYRIADAARKAFVKDELDRRDFMSITVQAGKFKLVSDAVDVAAFELRKLDRAQAIPQLSQFSGLFSRENDQFQSVIDAFTLAISDGEASQNLPFGSVPGAHAAFVQAGIGLWGSTIDLHRNDLTAHKASAQQMFLLGVVICVLPMIFAILVFIFVSRAFAARTDQEISTAGHFDDVTGLPNRKTLGEVLRRKIKQNNKETHPLSLFIVDLQRFKGINQRFGEKVGNQVLKSVATELKTKVGAFDFVARSGGNEFTILSDRLSTQGGINEFAQEILDQFKYIKLSAIKDHAIEVALGASSQFHSDSEFLFSDASIALKRAKAGGRGLYRYCDATIREHAHQSDALARDLAKAFYRDEIEPYFQPQICARTGAILGVEALVRWLHPTKGTLNPGHFLTIAEENGLMDEIERVVRRKALKAVALMRSEHGLDLHLGLNMTPEALASTALVDEMIAEIDRSGVPRHLISIEILESVLIDSEHSKQISAAVERLSKMGLNVELDDFGTGHSSLSNLRDLNVDRVKVDRSFISDIHSKPELQTITLALTQLARTLNVEILAEGVESEHELQWLMANQCDVIQGYLVARPMSLDNLNEWVGDYLQRMAKSPANENWLDYRPSEQGGGRAASQG